MFGDFNKKYTGGHLPGQEAYIDPDPEAPQIQEVAEAPRTRPAPPIMD